MCHVAAELCHLGLMEKILFLQVLQFLILIQMYKLADEKTFSQRSWVRLQLYQSAWLIWILKHI